ncbi:phage baseplate assembly protein V [Variovorax paradoxus]|uniref:phage baseplate assembly protein V n=1 Tax=Variovorax paradoxus TaxID=34073 RepID=UPI003ED09DA1
MPGPVDPIQLFADLQRQIANLVRTGTIAEVDHGAQPPLVRVQLTDNVCTDWRPYIEQRAGDTGTWNPPTVGECAVVFSPGGMTEGGFVLAGLPTAGRPPPSSDPKKTVTKYPDGCVIEYDHGAHALKVTLPGGGTADVTVPDAITVNCRTADITASESATVHSQQITLDAPQTTATGNMTVMGLLTFMGGLAGSGGGGVPGASGEARLNLPIYSTREIETTSTMHADGDITAGDISLMHHRTAGVVSGGETSQGPIP